DHSADRQTSARKAGCRSSHRLLKSNQPWPVLATSKALMTKPRTRDAQGGRTADFADEADIFAPAASVKIRLHPWLTLTWLAIRRKWVSSAAPWAAFLMLVLIATGCNGLFHRRAATPMPYENPLFIPPLDREFMWNQI